MADFDERRTDLLIQYVLVAAALQDDWRDRELGPIHLLKYSYLGDLAYAERHEGVTFTGSEWQFYHFGPWQAQVHDRIEPALAAIKANRKAIPSSRFEGDFIRFSLEPEDLAHLRERTEKELPLGVGAAVRAAVHEFGSNTAALLRHVYLTPPMLRAAPGETLVLRPDTDRSNRTASDVGTALTGAERKRRSQLLSALKDRVRERLSQNQVRRHAAVPQPRYDEVFAAGTEWLDALAGDPPESGNGELTFSTDIWKSPTRSDPDVP